MTLFYITNLLSVAIAEEIIRINNIEHPIACITNFGNKDYYANIKKSMNVQLWAKIDLCSVRLFKRTRFKDIALYRKSLNRQYKEFVNLIKKDNVNEVYLPNIVSEEEKILYYACKDNNITINFFEEGTNLYFNLDNQSSKLRRYIRWILAGKYRYVTYSREYFKADSIYCCFPDKYKFCNYNNKIKVNLKFDLNKNEKDKLDELNIDGLFLSRPLSEDNILTEDIELETLIRFFSTFNKKNIYVKFHPRESKEKIERIMKLIDIKEIPDDYKYMPAEKLVLYSNIKTLIGYETGTLAYASELKNVETYSLLNMIRNKSEYLNNIYNLYFNEFKKIRFID